MFPSYRNQLIDLHSISGYWFLYQVKIGSWWIKLLPIPAQYCISYRNQSFDLQGKSIFSIRNVTLARNGLSRVDIRLVFSLQCLVKEFYQHIKRAVNKKVFKIKNWPMQYWNRNRSLEQKALIVKIPTKLYQIKHFLNKKVFLP